MTHFADAFGPHHPAFKEPGVAIVGSAPLATAKISDNGEYQFTSIASGSYQLVLNCIVAASVQDESLLVDDPVQYQGFTTPNPEGITPNHSRITLAKDQRLIVNFIDERSKSEVDNESDVSVFADIADFDSYQGGAL